MACIPNLGDKAPNFSANTTQGPIKLSDYKGKWVVLFSHPGDFTPVCTTEFLCFAKYYSNFKKRNTELIGLSVDSNSSHLTWLYDIFLHTGIEIPFPVIDDKNMKISNLYGMISKPMSSTSTVRSVFIIDPNQILRTVLYYPLTTGRNIPEIVRIIDALQASDEQNIFTPADWLPGMPVLMPPPKTSKELKKRIKNFNKNKGCMDWYLCFMESNTNKQIEFTELNTRPQIDSVETNVPVNPNCPDLNRIVGTYVLGDPTNVDPYLLDFVIYAFIEINSDGTLSVPTPRYLRQLISLRNNNPDLQVIAAIGGWGQDGFSDAALTPSSRYNFARQVNAIIKEYDLDGIDIDWEYPGTSGAGIKSRPEDKENFTLLLTAIRDVIGQNKWLSVAGTGTKEYINKSAQIAKIAPLINYFNLMSYDFTAGENGENGKKHQSNLYESSLSLPGYSVDIMVNNLIENNMPSEKILLGIPFYGRLGATITKSYDQLRKDFINKNGYSYNFDKEAQTPYLTKDGEFAMAYDDILSIYMKTQYVINNCLGGIFSWMAPYDKANILAKAMSTGINNPNELKNEIEGTYDPDLLL